METIEIILKIKDCIKDAHKLSEGLGKSNSIHRDYLINCLNGISSTEIHIALLEMKDRGEIKILDDNPDVILLSENFK